LFVYATGRSSRISGGSEMVRPETIEETGELIQAANATGSALVVDHEVPTAVAELLAIIDRDHGRLDVLVNDVFGGDRYAEWDKPLLLPEMTDGTSLANAAYRRGVGFYYDLVKTNVERIVKGLSAELEDHPVTGVGAPGFGISESPAYVSRGVAALARDADACGPAGCLLETGKEIRRP